MLYCKLHPRTIKQYSLIQVEAKEGLIFTFSCQIYLDYHETDHEFHYTRCTSKGSARILMVVTLIAVPHASFTRMSIKYNAPLRNIYVCSNGRMSIKCSDNMHVQRVTIWLYFEHSTLLNTHVNCRPFTCSIVVSV